MATSSEQATIETMVLYAAERIDSGMSSTQVTSELLHNGYSLEQASETVRCAEALRKQDRRKDGQKIFAGGMGLVLLGCLITLGSWHWAGPGGTYLVSYGLFGVGGFFAFQGMYKVLRNADGMASFAQCFAALAVGMAVAGAAMAYALGTTVLVSTPPESTIDWRPDPSLAFTGNRYKVSGAIINTNAEWSIRNVTVEVQPVASSGDLEFDVIDVPVEPKDIGPGEIGRYSVTLSFPTGADSYIDSVVWEWGK